MADQYGYVLLAVKLYDAPDDGLDEHLSKLAHDGAFDIENGKVEAMLSEVGGSFAYSEAGNLFDAIKTLKHLDIYDPDEDEEDA